MKTHSNPAWPGAVVGAVVGAVAWFLLLNGVAFINDVVLGRTHGAQTGWGMAGFYFGVFLAPIGAGIGALVGWLIARSRAGADGSRDRGDESIDEPD